MTLRERIESLVALGNHLQNHDNRDLINAMQIAEIQNPWFSQVNIRSSIDAIIEKFLNEQSLSSFAQMYFLDDYISVKKVGLILAGNIPLVGFHDVLCCYLCGHQSLIKYSDKDKVLMMYVVNFLKLYHKDSDKYFIEIEKLTNYDAVIATGSNSTSKYFEFYFKDTPNIIRKNRNSIAIISGKETEEELTLLGTDIFSFFGLGCRNVSKVFVPENYDVTKLFRSFEPFKDLIHHNKYKNNYDYNVALNLLNKEPFLQNDLIILKEATPIISRIGSIHYEFYKDQPSLVTWIKDHGNEIQCIVSQDPIT